MFVYVAAVCGDSEHVFIRREHALIKSGQKATIIYLNHFIIK